MERVRKAEAGEEFSNLDLNYAKLVNFYLEDSLFSQMVMEIIYRNGP